MKTPTLKELDNVVNYMIIKLSYNLHICVPYKDGSSIIASMEKAEKVERSYDGKTIFSQDAIDIEFFMYKQKEYREAKMKLLLGVEDEELIDEDS